jgi:predicted MFS family arabinose efflux permease
VLHTIYHIQQESVITNRRDSFRDYLIEFPNFLSIFIFAIFFISLGPILLDISTTTGIDVGNLNLIFTFYTVGSVIGQLTSVLYNKKFKALNIILTGFIVLIPITFSLSFSNTLIAFYILYFIAGYILGVIWIQANRNIIRSKVENKDRLTTIALSFYPVGAFAAPFIASTIVSNNLSWRFLYYIISLIIIIIIIFYLTITRKVKYDTIKQEEVLSFKEIFLCKNKNTIFILTTFLLVAYCISETVIATWSPTFLRSEKMFDIQSAALFVSIFWISIIAGRVIVGFLAGKIKANYMVLILSGIAVASMFFMFLSDSKYFIFIAVIFAGLGFSGIFPLLISSGSTIYKKGKGVLLTILFASANLGISTSSYLTRFVSQHNMTLSVFLSIIFMSVTMILIIFHIFYKKRFVDREIK